jgi:copper chaperone
MENRLDLATMSTLKLKSAFNKGVAMQEFEIQSMTCGHCASRVAQAVRNLDTQARIEVDLQARTVRIETTEDRSSVVAALAEAGYPPKPPEAGAIVRTPT